MKIIDVNASFGFWPIQHFSISDLAGLDAVYESEGIGEVWLSAVESILFPEPDTYDVSLFERLSGFKRFRPVKTVNPILANWRKSCLSTLNRFPIAALKLFPNYHDYNLTSERLGEVCEFAREHYLPLLIQMRVNDERNQPRFLQVRGVASDELAALSHRYPGVSFIALCAYLDDLKSLADGGDNLLVDLSFLDDGDTIATVAKKISAERIVFGSNAPFLHIKAASLKLQHCPLPVEIQADVASGNLIRKLPTTGDAVRND